MRRLRRPTIAAVALILGIGAVVLPATDGQWTREIVTERDVPVRMRDGVTLHADVYRPREEGRYPALLMRTPYDKSGALQSGRLAMTVAAVRRGYVVVVQDTRGQYRSEGRFVPYAQEREDGHDTIAWVARLPYVDGKVATFGLSYPGAVQWMTAPTRPKGLVAMSPSMTFANQNHFFYHGGVFGSNIMPWLLGRQFRERQRLGLMITSPDELQAAWEAQGDAWTSHVPLGELPIMQAFPYWKEWLDNPIESEYWKPFDIEAQHDQVTVPALNLTGWNDDSYGQPGAIRNYVGMRTRGGSPDARKGQRLVIGPWSHGVPTLTRTTYGGIDYGPNAAIDFTDLQLKFFDYWLKGIDEGYSAEPPVRIFVMGDNVWRDEAEWPLARTRYTDLYLHPEGRLTSTAPGEVSPSTFVYDPHDPVRIPAADAEGRRDWSRVTSRRDVLTFTTDPFDRSTEITGHLVARLWVSSSAPDTDFTMRAFEIDRQGNMRPLTSAPGVLRARYRSTEEPRPPQPLPPAEATELTISLGYTSYVMPAGHRLQVFVTSSIFPDLHPNVWEPFRSRSQAVRANQTIHHDRMRPSRIVLPVIPR